MTKVRQQKAKSLTRSNKSRLTQRSRGQLSSKTTQKEEPIIPSNSLLTSPQPKEYFNEDKYKIQNYLPKFDRL